MEKVFEVPIVREKCEVYSESAGAISVIVNDWINSRLSIVPNIWSESKQRNSSNRNFIEGNKVELDSLTDQILRIISHRRHSYRSKQDIREILSGERETVFQRLLKNEPIKFVYLYNGGYRASYSERIDELVFVPDQTELLLVYQISLLQKSISEIYPPGIEFVIVVNNGVAFWVNDIPLTNTSSYSSKLRDLIKLHGASERIEVLVQSEMLSFNSFFDFSELARHDELLNFENVSQVQHRIVERFLGRNCSEQEAAIRLKNYSIAEGDWSKTLSDFYHNEKVIFMRQIAHQGMLSFRPFPGGAARIQNGTFGFSYNNGILNPKLITSETIKKDHLSNVNWTANYFPSEGENANKKNEFVGLKWNESEFDSKAIGSTGLSLFQNLKQVTLNYPYHIAVVENGQEFTFAQLYKRVHEIASFLNSLPDLSNSRTIALVQSLTLDYVASWFACNLVGKVILLLESDIPLKRVVELCKISECDLILADNSTFESIKELLSFKIIVAPQSIVLNHEDFYCNYKKLNENDCRIENSNYKTKFSNELHADDLAVIFPTSGSTGNPKLIAYSSRTMQVKVQSSIQLMKVNSTMRVVIAGNHGNFGFMHHALVFLFSAGTLCLHRIKENGFSSLVESIVRDNARNIRFTPSLFRIFAKLSSSKSALKMLDAVRFSGEPLLKNDLLLAKQVLREDCLIQNVYGSTESSLFIWNSREMDIFDDFPTVPIGKVYPMNQYAIIPIEGNNSNLSEGELVIKSAFHALGDYKSGLIDPSRFEIENELSQEKIYRTGDVVSQKENGLLIHLGRLERMVKIRGNRVFLSEVENHLSTISVVTNAAVVENIIDGNSELQGFITAKNNAVTSGQIRVLLMEKLPEYMVPKNIVVLEDFPLLRSGKVDYSKLRTMSCEKSSDDSFYNKIEGADLAQLARLWDSVLFPGAHSKSSDFLSLGGNSMSLMILATDIERVFNKVLPLEEFRKDSTFKGLCGLIGMISISDGLNNKRQEKIEFKMIWESSGHSKGVVLIMPGIGGWAPSYSIIQSQWFADYDVWSADYIIGKQGQTMRENNRWWKAANQIALEIRDGRVPQPKIYYGFSFGGGLAWIVSRLLSNYALQPDLLVLVDSAPLHRTKQFHHKELAELLRQTADKPFPPSLLILRALLPRKIIGRSSDLWQGEDRIGAILYVPTIDHIEMSRNDVLQSLKNSVYQFLRGEKPENQNYSDSLYQGIPGFKIYRALVGNDEVEIDKLLNDADQLKRNEIITIIFVLFSNNHTESALKLLEYALKKWPNNKLFHFLQRRKNRKRGQIVISQRPKYFPLILFNAESALSNYKNTDSKSSSIFTYRFLFFWDLVIVFFVTSYWEVRVYFSSRK